MRINDEGKRLIYVSCIICMAVAALAAVLIDDTASYASGDDFLAIVGKKGSFVLGIFSGFIFSTVKTAVTYRDGSSCGSASEYLLWFILSGALLLISALLPQISFLGAFFGILSLKLSGYFVVSPLRKRF